MWRSVVVLAVTAYLVAALVPARVSRHGCGMTTLRMGVESAPEVVAGTAPEAASPAAAEAKPKAKKAKKVAPKKLTARERTGLVYKDDEGQYDVPLLDDHRWYRLSVRKASEKRLTEFFNELAQGTGGASASKFSKVIEEAFYPSSSYVKFKGKALMLDTKPMVPGLVYIKSKMGPDVADDLELIQGIYGLSKNAFGFVEPLGEDEAEEIEIMKRRQVKALSPELLLMKKEEYVTVVNGPHKGKYGILMGTKKGRMEVCLRSDYRDEWDVIPVDDLRYFAEPPEKKWKTMSAREAVESLMAKDPKNPTIRSLRDQGLLEEIMYPDGHPKRRREPGNDNGDGGRGDATRFQGGREGGREGGSRVRSIATRDVRRREGDMGRNGPPPAAAAAAEEGGGWGDSPVHKPERSFDSLVPKPQIQAQRSGSVAKGMDDWGTAGVRGAVVSTGGTGSGSDGGGGDGGGDRDFDSFIEDLLSDFDTPSGSAASGASQQAYPWDRKTQVSQASRGKSSTAAATAAAATTAAPVQAQAQAQAQAHAQVETDRSDSERFLDELLSDLQSTTSRSGGPASAGSARSAGSGGAAAATAASTLSTPSRGPNKGATGSIAAGGGEGTGSRTAPKMEDFGSFEVYLDALVTHERRDPAGAADSDAMLVSLLDGPNVGSSCSGSSGSGGSSGNINSSIGSSSSGGDSRPRIDLSQDDGGAPSMAEAGNIGEAFEDNLESFLDSLDGLGLDLDTPPATKRGGGGGGGHGNMGKKPLTELKALLKARGLPVSGKKADLIARLEGQ